MSNPKPVKEQLIDLFNDQLELQGITTPYVEADLVFAAPVAYDAETIDASEPESANTSVLVTAGEDLTQIQYQLHYCRLDFAHLASLKDDFFEAALNSNEAALLPILSTHLGVEVTAADVEALVLTDVTAEDAKLVVTASADSLAFRGTATFTVLAPEA